MNTTADQLTALDAMAAHMETARANGHVMVTPARCGDGAISSECARCAAYVEVLKGCHQWLADHFGITDKCGEGAG